MSNGRSLQHIDPTSSTHNSDTLQPNVVDEPTESRQAPKLPLESAHANLLLHRLYWRDQKAIYAVSINQYRGAYMRCNSSHTGEEQQQDKELLEVALTLFKMKTFRS